MDVAPGRVPRVIRLMALEVQFEKLLQDGVVRGYAEIFRLGHVSRARLTQIMNLGPEIQEAILLLPRIDLGRAPITEGQLCPIAAQMEWGR